MEEELKNLKNQLEMLRNEYALDFDISHCVNRLIEEIQYWEQCQGGE